MATSARFNTPDPTQKATEILPTADFNPLLRAKPLQSPTRGFSPQSFPQVNLISDRFPS